jgi:hypothetical protein
MFSESVDSRAIGDARCGEGVADLHSHLVVTDPVDYSTKLVASTSLKLAEELRVGVLIRLRPLRSWSRSHLCPNPKLQILDPARLILLRLSTLSALSYDA